MRSFGELRDEQYSGVITKTKSELVEAVNARGWYRDASNWGCISMLGLFLSIPLCYFAAQYHWGLAALPIPIIALILFVTKAGKHPLTAVGSATLAQGEGFRLYLETAETDTLRFEEGQDIFSKYLPYAIVFSVADRWTKLFARLGEEGRYQPNTAWYSGDDAFTAATLSSSVSSLTTSLGESMASAVAAARQSAAATSGSSGSSGSSGGGGSGGGGGGSW